MRENVRLLLPILIKFLLSIITKKSEIKQIHKEGKFTPRRKGKIKMQVSFIITVFFTF